MFIKFDDKKVTSPIWPLRDKSCNRNNWAEKNTNLNYQGENKPYAGHIDNIKIFLIKGKIKT